MNADIMDSACEKMEKTVDSLKKEFSEIRAGRANPAVLDRIKVDYYGTPTAINQIGAVSVPQAQTLVIQPWDKTSLKLIEKAITDSDLGITPQNDGSVIRINFPSLTEDRRKEITKTIKKQSEEAKVALRNIRRDTIEQFKSLKKKSEITEDDLKTAEKDTQKLIDKFIEKIEKISEEKEKEIMTV